MSTDAAAPLRFTTWLAPGLPYDLFDTIATHVSTGLGRDYELSVEPKISGPLSAEDDRFAKGLTDVGFICPPSYLWLTDGDDPSVRLVPRAPIYDDPRNGGRPRYVSDVVVRTDADIECFADLQDRVVGFNERASLSGFVSLLARLESDGLDLGFFAELRQVGSHRRALDLIEAGELDGAAIDANVLRTWRRERADGGAALRSVDVLGPYPVQPVVVRTGAGPELVEAVARELARPEVAAAVRAFGLTGFGAVSTEDYEAIRPAVERAMALAPS
ncbi:MAG: PhnD/SsuA/transferrin family substrate-binding protein [Actinomycetota bacterium]